AAVEQVLQQHPQAVRELREGKEKAFGFLMGQAMRALDGKGSPELVRRALHEQLRAKG
ncbi:MAG: Asp-tRNA(Asn)/Glu-tRNA(Gln) amidotransferase GatCAB subunit B, partial [Oscillospiraceae bacterium]|nr:Asp-tRNA(Asn)/Glu-tRNA(Gln) amidotransferase GatCAB subunit B [Oscillospiraceae bacterium]